MTRAARVAAGVGLAAVAVLAADGRAAGPRDAGTTVSAPGPRDPVEEASARLIGAALVSRRAYQDLADLCDRIGNRLAGSEALDRAVAWSMERMRAAGLEGVRAEEVKVPVWIRGEERATLLHPLEHPLPMMGLGGSVGTPPGGIEADVLVARDFAHLESLGEAVRGRIVLFDVPFTEYGETVAYRGRGASAAARLGAVAALIRSVTPTSLSTPHTGALGYADDAPRIPAAALTVEDAASLHRLADRGIVPRVRLEMEAHEAPDTASANVVGEVRGREHPGEVVVLGCHLDSWDVGQGAQDDGAGCVTVLEAARLIGALPQRPRRTVRVVFYTNEENGLRGARAYAEQHRDELPRHVAAVEADTGSGAPLGFRVHVPGGGDGEDEPPLAGGVMARLREVEALLEPLSAAHLRLAYGGADIGPLVAAGVPGFGLDQDMSGYWPIHHTSADTFDKVDPKLLARNVAAVAVLAYWLAEIPEPLPRPSPGGGAP